MKAGILSGMERSLSAESGTLQSLPAAKEAEVESDPGMVEGSRLFMPRPCPDPGPALSKHAVLCTVTCPLKHPLLDTLTQLTGCLCHQLDNPPPHSSQSRPGYWSSESTGTNASQCLKG